MLQPGHLIGGRYRVERLLGEGGMAHVYGAIHETTRRATAVKVLKKQLAEHPAVREKFQHEVHIGALLGDCPFVVDVLDAGWDDEAHALYMAMPLLDGETLARRIARGPIPGPDVVHLVGQLARALDLAHQKGVVHRDLKPGNLFLTADFDGHPRLVVLDFGIAKLIDLAADRTGTEIGTPLYAAPDQLSAAYRRLAAKNGLTLSTVGAWTDVWPLGLIVYEMLTGLEPGQLWQVESAADVPLRVLDESPVPSRAAGDRADRLPGGFDAWFGRCVARNGADRWPTMGAAAAGLAGLSWSDARPPDVAAIETSLAGLLRTAPSGPKPAQARHDGGAPLPAVGGTLDTRLAPAASTFAPEVPPPPTGTAARPRSKARWALAAALGLAAAATAVVVVENRRAKAQRAEAVAAAAREADEGFRLFFDGNDLGNVATAVALFERSCAAASTRGLRPRRHAGLLEPRLDVQAGQGSREG